jgi:hypothetical protein
MKMTLCSPIFWIYLVVGLMLFGCQKSKTVLFIDESIGDAYLVSTTRKISCEFDIIQLKQQLAEIKLKTLNQLLPQIKGIFTLKHPFIKKSITYPSIELINNQYHWIIPLSGVNHYVFLEVNDQVSVYEYPDNMSFSCME